MTVAASARARLRRARARLRRLLERVARMLPRVLRDRFRRLSRPSRENFVTTVILLAVATAVMYGAFATVAYAQAPLPPPPGSPAPSGSPQNAVQQYLDALRAIQASKHPLLYVGLPLAVLLVVVLLVVAYFSRRASKVSLIWGLASFELPDELRKAKQDYAELVGSYNQLSGFASDFALLTASLNELASTPAQIPARHFIAGCAEAARNLLATHKTSAWLLDPSANVLRIYAGQRVSIRTLREFYLRRGEGFAGYVFETARPHRLDDVSQHNDKFVRDPHSPQPLGAIIGVPIWGPEHKPVGVLCASHQPGTEIFTQDSEVLLTPLADLIAVTLHLATLARVDLWQGLDYAPVKGK